MLNFFCFHEVTFFRSNGLSLGDCSLSCLLRFVMRFVVFHPADSKIVLAPRLANMFCSNVKPLDNLAVPYDFPNFYPNGSRCHVEHHPCLAVVEMVRHALLNCGVDHNVDVVTLAKDLQVPTEGGHAMTAEGLREFLAGASTVSKGMRHF